MAAAINADGGEENSFESAADEARSRVRREYGPSDFVGYASPAEDADGVVGALVWAMESGRPVLHEAVRSDRLDDEDGAAPRPDRTDRAFLFGLDDDENTDPEVRVLGSFVNRWDDERVVLETPAPWETPDGMTAGNDLVKSLEWEEHHYSFEETLRRPGIEAENVWVIDTSGVEPLREAAEAEGYEWTEDGGAPTQDEETVRDLSQFLEAADYDRDERELVGGDHVTVRYESKQTGDIKQRSGVVNIRGGGSFSFERDDGRTNKVKAEDGEVGIYSTSRYPFMGRVVSVEVRTAE